MTYNPGINSSICTCIGVVTTGFAACRSLLYAAMPRTSGETEEVWNEYTRPSANNNSRQKEIGNHLRYSSS